MHRNEGHTLLGIGWVQGALGLSLVFVLATAIVSLTVIPGLFAALGEGQNLSALHSHLAAIVGYLGLSGIIGVGIALLGGAGFRSLHRGRREHGEGRAHHVSRGLVFLFLGGGFLIAPWLLPHSPAVAVGVPDEVVAVVEWALPYHVLFCGLGALFAGLALHEGVFGLADPSQTGRIGTAITLGVVSAVVSCLMGCVGTMTTQIDVFVTALISETIVGEGLGAISVVLFLLVYRDVRRSLLVTTLSGAPGDIPPPSRVPHRTAL